MVQACMFNGSAFFILGKRGLEGTGSVLALCAAILATRFISFVWSGLTVCSGGTTAPIVPNCEKSRPLRYPAPKHV